MNRREMVKTTALAVGAVALGLQQKQAHNCAVIAIDSSHKDAVIKFCQIYGHKPEYVERVYPGSERWIAVGFCLQHHLELMHRNGDEIHLDLVSRELLNFRLKNGYWPVGRMA